jgi:predicted nucleic acid-binding protein
LGKNEAPPVIKPMKPRIYLESSFISVLTARPSYDMVKQVRQQRSQDLWDLRLQTYEAFCSPLVIEEILRGDPHAAALRNTVCQQLPILPIKLEAQRLAKQLIERGAVPPTEPEDALHIALAATEKMDYIASWNFAHLVGVWAKIRLQKTLAELGFDRLAIATPEEIIENLIV